MHLTWFNKKPFDFSFFLFFSFNQSINAYMFTIPIAINTHNTHTHICSLLCLDLFPTIPPDMVGNVKRGGVMLETFMFWDYRVLVGNLFFFLFFYPGGGSETVRMGIFELYYFL